MLFLVSYAGFYNEKEFNFFFKLCFITNLMVKDVECHATGTRVGDFMEATAIGQVFGTDSRKQPLLISSSRR
jgi:Beta-ketoacyl synthase, C-terminal domain